MTWIKAWVSGISDHNRDISTKLISSLWPLHAHEPKIYWKRKGENKSYKDNLQPWGRENENSSNSEQWKQKEKTEWT